MLKKIIKLLLIILWMSLIFSLSNDTGEKSTKKSDSFIIKIVETFTNKKLSDEKKEEIINKYVYITRKSAHIFIYLILGLLLISFLYEYNILNYKRIIIAIIIAILYALTDEFHQLFISGRSGSIIDTIIDSIGSILGIYFYNIIYKIRRHLHEQKETIC